MKVLILTLKGLSRLPLGVLYIFADLCFPILYYLMRYRRRVVRENIARSFPEKSQSERLSIERKFYRFFCDYVVETLHLLSMSEEEMRRRMVVEGVPDMEDSLTRHPFVFIYLGHYCNWEWISSIPLWSTRSEHVNGQLYRPLKNKAYYQLFMDLRTRFGAVNISKYEALRHILTYRKEGRRAIIGFISDQSPKPISIHEWVNFLHQDTPVFTGTERIGKRVDAAVYFADVRRVKRGYYHLTLRCMTEDIHSYPDFRLTELYMAELEKMIQRQPHLWLWSHKRWKHKREAVEALQRQHAAGENRE